MKTWHSVEAENFFAEIEAVCGEPPHCLVSSPTFIVDRRPCQVANASGLQSDAPLSATKVFLSTNRSRISTPRCGLDPG